jgi:hypothetical protein
MASQVGDFSDAHEAAEAVQGKKQSSSSKLVYTPEFLLSIGPAAPITEDLVSAPHQPVRATPGPPKEVKATITVPVLDHGLPQTGSTTAQVAGDTEATDLAGSAKTADQATLSEEVFDEDNKYEGSRSAVSSSSNPATISRDLAEEMSRGQAAANLKDSTTIHASTFEQGAVQDGSLQKRVVVTANDGNVQPGMNALAKKKKKNKKSSGINKKPKPKSTGFEGKFSECLEATACS